MSNLDPPTVLTRRPPTDSPDQPSSPAPSPSRSQSLDQETILSESTSTRPFFNGQDSRERSEDGRGRGKGKGPERRESRWRELLTEWKLLLSLENSGSVARDHLASERTFLAYARTSLTIASTGVVVLPPTALVQLFTLSATTTNKDFERYARPVGSVMIGLGLFTLAIGVTRFFLVQDALIRGMYPVARITPTFLSFVLSVVVIVVFVVILITR